MEQYTVEEFQSDFDNLLARVEKGESFQINYEGKSVMIIPATKYQETVETITEAKPEDWDDFWYDESTLCDI
jgi:antitoxin (DNA-binding transcriptional repressor) of toxin-antitoxin stability system